MITECSGWPSQQSFPSRVLRHLRQHPQQYPHASLRGSLWILTTMTTDKEKLFIYRCYLCTGHHRGHNLGMAWGEDQIGKAKRDA